MPMHEPMHRHARAPCKPQETLASRKAERTAEREALGRGEMPESLAKWKVRGACACMQQ